ncbi:MAG TPA: uracil-DNA glycosylase, partial [Acidobacteria bacterium]|nr:uracil-DNA glycosylase [Acidobacteriota bacterium]
LLFVGEGPGADEDRIGEPFVGKAGKLLDRIIGAMGLSREEVYIANVVKCRPPGNRAPLPDESATCLPFLHEQIRIIQPEVIVTLGRTALEGLLGEPVRSITRSRGRWFRAAGVPVMATFHPAYLLRNPAAKRPVWEDMQEVLARLGLSPPPRQSG